MTRVVEEWPVTHWLASDDKKARSADGYMVDVVVLPTHHHDRKWGDYIPYTSEPVDLDVVGYTEFDITTDPTEAPADALLEAAGYYVEPGDRTYYELMKGKLNVVANASGCRPGHFHWESDLVGKWDPYSWDVKADHIPCETWTVVSPALTTPCTRCAGTGKTHGVFLPDSWTCDVCDGKGVL